VYVSSTWRLNWQIPTLPISSKFSNCTCFLLIPRYIHICCRNGNSTMQNSYHFSNQVSNSWNILRDDEDSQVPLSRSDLVLWNIPYTPYIHSTTISLAQRARINIIYCVTIMPNSLALYMSADLFSYKFHNSKNFIHQVSLWIRFIILHLLYCQTNNCRVLLLFLYVFQHHEINIEL